MRHDGRRGRWPSLRGALEAVDASSAFQYLLKGKLEPYADLPYIELPEDPVTHTLYGARSEGHHIYCMPEQDLVVAIASRRTGRWRDRRLLLAEFVIPSVIG